MKKYNWDAKRGSYCLEDQHDLLHSPNLQAQERKLWHRGHFQPYDYSNDKSNRNAPALQKWLGSEPYRISSSSSQATFWWRYFSRTRHSDSVRIQTSVADKVRCHRLTASFITAVSEERLLPPWGRGRPSGKPLRADEIGRWRGKAGGKKMSVASLSLTGQNCTCCPDRRGLTHAWPG